MAQYTALLHDNGLQGLSLLSRPAPDAQAAVPAQDPPGSPLRGVGIALLLEAAVGSLGFLVWFAVHTT